jgi:hypothetical protein
MKVSIKEDHPNTVEWVAVSGSPSEVAELLSQGREVGPLRIRVGRSDRFLSADWLFVSLKRTPAVVAGLIGHPFTERHAGLIWVSDGGPRSASEVDCLIGFPMTAEITVAADYEAATSGLMAIYGEATTVEPLRGWSVGSDGLVKELAGSFDAVAVDRLLVIGRESRSHAGKGTKGFYRSALRLDLMQPVGFRDGKRSLIASLDAGTRVECPVHLDLDGVAEVIGSGDAKGVQCAVCGRNFWVTPPKRSVDFDHFRRVFGEFHAHENLGDVTDGRQQFRLLRERFLPPLDLADGITFIRSPMGSGKTQSAVPLVDECRARGLSVLVIGHRRGLLRALAQRLGLDLYFETLGGDGDSAEYRAVAVSDGYAICLDSMPTRLQPAVHKFDVVIIDEAEQAVRHLAGGTLKAKRRLAYVTFGHYIAAARSVYLLDAHLGELARTFVFQFADPGASVRFLVNEPPVEHRQYELVTTREGVLAKLGEAVAAGKKCYLATNSKNRAIATELWIRQHWPELRVLAVTHENAQLPEVQEVLCNLADEFEHGGGNGLPLDVLIGSPAIGTGIDITFKDGAAVVDHVFGIFEAGITTHFDVDQQLARVRNPGCVSVWICPEILSFETDPSAVRRELANTVARTDTLVGFERNGLPIFSDHDQPLVELWAQITATERASKNSLFENWTALRERDGWTGVVVNTTDPDKNRGKAAMAEGKRLREAERVGRIAGAAEVDDMEGARLDDLDKKGGLLTSDERAQLERWHLREFYVYDVDEALVAFDDGGRTRRMVEVLEVLVGEPVTNRAIDRHENSRNADEPVIAFDRQFRSARAEILDRLLVAAGLVDPRSGAFNVGFEVDTEGLGAFVLACREDKRRIQSELGLDIRGDIDQKPVQQLGRVLGLFGVDLVLASTTKANGKKRRIYRINSDRLAAIMDVVARRADRQRERWEAKSQSRGDNGPPDDLKELQTELSPDGEGDEGLGGNTEPSQTRPPEGGGLASAVSALKAKRATEKQTTAGALAQLQRSIGRFSLNI